MSWLFKPKVIKQGTVTAYSMPTLESFSSSELEGALSGKKDPEVIEREAFEQGFASGEKAGYEAGEQKATVLIDQLERLFKEIFLLKEKILSELEPQVVLLSIELARKILREELKTNPELIEKMIKDAIKAITPMGPLTIRLNPAPYDRIIKNKNEFQSIFPELIFEMDPKAPAGGAVVRNGFQEVQTDFDFQLSNIIEELRSRGDHDGSDSLL